MTERVIDIRGLRKSYGDVEAVRGIDLHVDRGRGLRAARPQRRRQDDDRRDPRGLPRADGGRGRGPRPRSRRSGAPTSRTGSASSCSRPASTPTSRSPRPSTLYAGYYPRRGPLDEVIELVGLDGEAEHAREQALRRAAAPPRRRGGARRRSGAAVPGRADDRLRPGRPAQRVGDRARTSPTLGKTIFLTTHYMDEAQYLADRVAIIAKGEIVAEGPPATLAGRDTMRTRIRFRLPEGARRAARSSPDATASPDGSSELRTDEPDEGAARPDRLGARASGCASTSSR